MTRISLAVLATLCGVLYGGTASAHAAGVVVINCGHGHFAQVDPIIKSSPMTPPDPSAISGHLHEFFANTNVDSNSTVASLMQGQSTCQVASDINAIWVPAMIGPGGQPIPALSVEYRIGNQSPTPSDVHKPPNGLTMLSGHDPERTVSGPPTSSFVYQCLRLNVPGLPNAGGPQLGRIPQATECPPGATEIRLLAYGSLGCWDGVHMGPGLQRGDGPIDAKSHATTFGTMDCPMGVKLPFFTPIMRWPASAAGGHLSSDHGDPGASFHWDLIWMHGKNTSGQDFWDQVLSKCLNNPVAYITCRSQPDGTLVGDHGVGVVLQAGPNVPPAVTPTLPRPVAVNARPWVTKPKVKAKRRIVCRRGTHRVRAHKRGKIIVRCVRSKRHRH